MMVTYLIFAGMVTAWIICMIGLRTENHTIANILYQLFWFVIGLTFYLILFRRD